MQFMLSIACFIQFEYFYVKQLDANFDLFTENDYLSDNEIEQSISSATCII